MHTTASSLVAIAQYFWWICTSVLYGNQQIFNIEAVNDYPPIRIRIVAADSIRDSVWMEIFDSQVSMYKIYSRLCESHFLWHTVYNMHQCFLVSDVIYQNNRVLLRPFLETAQRASTRTAHCSGFSCGCRRYCWLSHPLPVQFSTPLAGMLADSITGTAR